MTPKEDMFKRIREALVSLPMGMNPEVDLETSVYHVGDDDLPVLFAENFVARGGRLIYCTTVDEALRSVQELVSVQPWDGQVYCADEDVQSLLEVAKVSYASKPIDAVLRRVGFCKCRALVADTGSVVIDSQSGGRRILAHAESLVLLASVDQICRDMHELMKQFRSTRDVSMISVWTGRSCILDIDGQAMQGLGPRNVYLLLIDEIDTSE